MNTIRTISNSISPRQRFKLTLVHYSAGLVDDWEEDELHDVPLAEGGGVDQALAKQPSLLAGAVQEAGQLGVGRRLALGVILVVACNGKGRGVRVTKHCKERLHKEECLVKIYANLCKERLHKEECLVKI